MHIQVATSILSFIVMLLIVQLIKISIYKIAKIRHIRDKQRDFIYKVIKSSIFIGFVLVLVSVWGIGIKNIWMFLTSIVGIVAIGFFAVWSILSNICAGIFLFISNPFRMGDRIVIIQDGISGKVTDMKLLFLVLEDDDGGIIHIPNNLLFQKAVKTVKK